MRGTWAAELVPHGIRVNVAAPGPNRHRDDGARARGRAGGLDRADPAWSHGTPAEVAAAALFLLSDEASYIAGVEQYVDEGMRQV